MSRLPEIEALIAGAASHERMSDEFEKWHLGDGRALHHFTGADRGGPHDHPWPFHSQIVAGGYVERVYIIDHDTGTWSSERIERRPGDTFVVAAEHIHEIVELPQGECWTIVTAGQATRETRFWRFGPDRIEWQRWVGPFLAETSA